MKPWQSLLLAVVCAVAVSAVLIGFSFPSYKFDILQAQEKCGEAEMMSIQTQWYPWGTYTIARCFDDRVFRIED